MELRGHEIGVCSWSLRPTGMRDLLEKMRTLGVDRVQLALEPLLKLDDAARDAEIHLLQQSGVLITAAQIGFAGEDYTSLISIRKTGGLVPDSEWPKRKDLAIRAGKLAGTLGISGLSLHVGFLPQSNDPSYAPVLARVCEIAEPLVSQNIHLLLETGQETANELLQFLNDLRCQNVACNFDPANLLMYGVGDPLDSVAVLGRHIRHVHVKDADSSKQPGTIWGKEVELGRGQVPWPSIVDALGDVGYTGPLVVECEFDPTLLRVREALAALQAL